MDIGLDVNGDGTLSEDEIDETFYLCNGMDHPDYEVGGGGLSEDEGCSVAGGRRSSLIGVLIFVLGWFAIRRRHMRSWARGHLGDSSPSNNPQHHKTEENQV